MVKNKETFSMMDMQIMKGNLKLDGWETKAFLPIGWLVSNPTVNVQRYITDSFKLLENTKDAVDFMKKNKFNSEDVVRLKFGQYNENNEIKKELIKHTDNPTYPNNL